MNVQDIHLDIDKRVSPADVVRIGQGDAGGTTIRAHIFDNGVAADLTGMTAVFEMRLPNTYNFVRDARCTVSGNTITYVVDESKVASIAGTSDAAYFDILQGGDVIYSTERFTIDVLRSAHDGAEPAESWDNAVDELIARGNEQLALYEEAEQAREDAEEVRNNSVITGADATIDDTAGTPSVSVTLDAPSALGRLIHFAFNHFTGGGDVTAITNAQIDTISNDGSVTSTNVLTGTGLTYLWGKIKAKFAAAAHEHAASDVTSGTFDTARIPNLSTDKLTSGTLPVSRGGTGKTTHTSNAVITGNGTSAVKNVSTASGAFYATSANGAAQFGTLPIAQGGTGATTAAGAVVNIVDGQAIAPASVAATGEVSAKSGTGSSAVTHKLTEKAQDSRADALEASIAYVESTTARTNHASGDYFMLGDVLMKATAAIAAGEQITTSNATPATVQSQIDTLRDSVSWKSGDTFQVSALVAGGFITGSKEVFFMIPLSKPMYGTPSVTFATLAIRQNGSYPFGFSGNKPTVNYQMILTNSINWINVRLVFDSAAGVNNESVSVYAYGTVTVA